jgi:hypothetical protein
MSAESAAFVLKSNNGWPLWMILSVGFGAFIIAVTVGLIIFSWYYKYHVKVPVL